MKPVVFLDFDGVLFDSVPEVYSVCIEVSQKFPKDYVAVSFEKFCEFRSYLTDAWQFNRLFSRDVKLENYNLLSEINATELDWVFTSRFFEARKRLMADDDWAKAMKPYDFFTKIKPLLLTHEDKFVIISTRNEESIARTLEYHGVRNIQIFGQEAVRKYGSKLQVLDGLGFIRKDNYMIYVDDMRGHLEPFEDQINLCLQASWGYDTNNVDAFSQKQVERIIKSVFLKTNNQG